MRATVLWNSRRGIPRLRHGSLPLEASSSPILPDFPSDVSKSGSMAHTETRSTLAPLPSLIFGSRWLQLPLYLGLIVAQGVYVVLFLKELWHLMTHATTFSEQQIMLVVLGLIDVVMISNLLVMVIVGGYETFVSRLRLQGHPDQPEWLDHVNASVLKIKLAMAIIGISSIHLLRTFIEAGNIGQPGARYTETAVLWQTIIHVVFILSAIGIAMVDRMGNYTPASKAHKASEHSVA
jgi:uncharacterized protein (TIGR00645 family)